MGQLCCMYPEACHDYWGVFALDIERGDNGQPRIVSRSGNNPIPIKQLVPHPNTEKLQPGKPAVGHVEYSSDGTGRFCTRDGKTVAQESAKDGVTAHAKEYEKSTGNKLKPGDGKTITGTSWDGSKIRTRSGTHNTGAGAHCDQDRYTPDGSRKAGPVEQDMIQDMYKNGRGTGTYNVNSLTQRQALWR